MLTINQDEMSTGFPVLSQLKDHYGFDQWMVVRIHDTDCIVIASSGDGYDISKGMVFKLNLSIGSDMPQFKEPKVVPNIESDCEHLSFINSHLPIQSYLHFPIINKEHGFFGSLCAISKQAQINFMQNELDEINSVSQTLTEQLDKALASSKVFRADCLRKIANDRDETTQLFNWRGWERLLDSEEIRCQRFGYLGDIITIDFVGLTDYMSEHGGQFTEQELKKIALILSDTVSEDSIVARVGGSEFVVCSINNEIASIEQYGNSILKALSNTDIQVFVGYARSIPNKGLRYAWELAEHMLYKEKINRLLD